MKKTRTRREESKLLLKYEAWLGGNVTQIDNAYISGDFTRAHLGIMTLFSNMRQPDREGFIKFAENHKKDYGWTRENWWMGLDKEEIESLLNPFTGMMRERQISSPLNERKWRDIYRAMIDFFGAKGYLFQTRTFEVGEG